MTLSNARLLRRRQTWLVLTHVLAGALVAGLTFGTEAAPVLVATAAVAVVAAAQALLPTASRRVGEARVFRLAAIVPVIAFFVSEVFASSPAVDMAALIVMAAALLFEQVLIHGSTKSKMARRLAPAAFA